MRSYFVDVILPLPLPKPFTYQITEAEHAFISTGVRLVVPFGNKKKYAALALKTHTQVPAYQAKSIEYIIDERSLITSSQLKLWQWVSDYYMCPMGLVMRAAIPSMLLLESETELVHLQAPVSSLQISNQARLLCEKLATVEKIPLSQISDFVSVDNPLKLVQELLRHKLVATREEVYGRYAPKEEVRIALSQEFSKDDRLLELLTSLQKHESQRQTLLQMVQQKQPIKRTNFYKLEGVSKSSVQTLLKKEVFVATTHKVDRLPIKTDAESPLSPLTQAQKKVRDQIQNNNSPTTHLLHGVTASGKTEVYMHLIQDVLQAGKQVLFLVPEIALTAQLIQRLHLHFGKKMAVYHSRYSQSERVEVWNALLENKPSAQLIVGARSAVLLPFSNLGLIVVDESHEYAYKQFEAAPRYHARDAAVVLGQILKAPVVLGSATPSMESYHNATNGKYHLNSLNERFQGFQLPTIELVDLKTAQKKQKMQGVFSVDMIEAITQTLEKGDQIILFQNRRGYAPFISCMACGHVPQCTNCDVSLTYHSHSQQLKCHYCDYATPKHSHCTVCGTPHPRTIGFGTQQVEEEVVKLFPEARVARMDTDTTRGKNSHQQLIDRFQNRELDILVGTQMLTKGLDFGGVSLVGVVQADGLLNFPNFRANERAFQMLLQVAGRAGRSSQQGRVLVQTYDVNHPVLKQLLNADYNSMVSTQLSQRSQFKYPPFQRLIQFEFKHKSFAVLQEAANWFAKALKGNFTDVLGPQSPPVGRIRNQYVLHILLKLPADKSTTAPKTQIKRVVNRMEQIAAFRSVRLNIDVDPI
ncbi:MAG: primosomal protein N' [Flavobacteriaceae bacterium]|jgi:primosomal protein N' (replication factor Y)